MPKLKGSEVVVGAFRRAKQEPAARAGETRVTCQEEGCDWTTIRPDEYAWSAGEAHRIQHRKGML